MGNAGNTLLCVYAEFFALIIGIVAVLGGIAAFIRYFDRIIVALMRCFNIIIFPTAISIAMLILEHPEQWSHDQYRMSHPDIGSIWIANESYGLKVETAFGDWIPNFIERRIIRDAVDWRINQYIKRRITQALQRNALSNMKGNYHAV